MLTHGLFQISAEDYHNDPCDTPSLSASIAHILDSQSPLHAYTRHPRLGGIPRPHTKSFDIGSLSHAILLGNGKEAAIIDASDYRTKLAQEARDSARALGQIPVLAEEYEHAKEVADTLTQRFAEYGIVLDGASEVAAFWSETTSSGEQVQCRGMLDHKKSTTIYDLKSCRSAHPIACQRHVEAYGYAIQRAAYVSAVEHILPELAGRLDFVFVFYELVPPFAVNPVRLSGEFCELGARKWRRSVDKWATCLRANNWPGYADSISTLAAPQWAMKNDMERQIAAAGWLEEFPI